jgi:hypothetical protein
MKSEYTIIRYSNKYQKALSTLYFESYGRKKPLSYFDYRLNSFGSSIAFLMKFGNKLVGFYAVVPIKLKIKNEFLFGGSSFLTMTHPDHSGKGVFLKLALKTFQEAKKKNYKFILGFANSNSYPIFIKKLGFKELFPINNLKIKNFNNFNEIVYKKSRIPKNIINLWNEYDAQQNFSVKLERNYEYLHKKFVQHPVYNYFIFHEKNKFLFIFKKYKNMLHIIDFFGIENNEFYLTLFGVAKNLAKINKCDTINLWIPKKHNILGLLKNNTKSLSTDSFFIIKCLDPKFDPLISEINNWYYTMTDADIF